MQFFDEVWPHTYVYIICSFFWIEIFCWWNSSALLSQSPANIFKKFIKIICQMYMYISYMFSKYYWFVFIIIPCKQFNCMSQCLTIFIWIKFYFCISKSVKYKKKAYQWYSILMIFRWKQCYLCANLLCVVEQK